MNSFMKIEKRQGSIGRIKFLIRLRSLELIVLGKYRLNIFIKH